MFIMDAARSTLSADIGITALIMATERGDDTRAWGDGDELVLLLL